MSRVYPLGEMTVLAQELHKKISALEKRRSEIDKQLSAFRAAFKAETQEEGPDAIEAGTQGEEPDAIEAGTQGEEPDAIEETAPRGQEPPRYQKKGDTRFVRGVIER